MENALLEGRGVTKFFGGLAALSGVDFQVFPGEIMGLIGPNGSGKTTLFDCLTRVQKVSRGEIHFKGQEITDKKPYQVAHLGLARTFQVIRVYRKLTVWENMLLCRQWGGMTLAQKFQHPAPQQGDRADRAHDRAERASGIAEQPSGICPGIGLQPLRRFGKRAA